MPNLDLSLLPAPQVVEPLDFETLLKQRKAQFIALSPPEQQAAISQTLNYESEPITKLLQENTYRELLLRQRINEAAQATLLAYAKDADLDQIGANYQVKRLILQAANPDVILPLALITENDTDFRLRIQQAFEGLSVAGSTGAYEFHALSADGRVADASAISPSPACVTLTVLSRENNGVASAELLAHVNAALNDENIRPVADRLTVQSATIIDYRIDATLTLYPKPEAEPIRMAAENRLTAYISTQRRLGRDIRLSAIYGALHVKGVQRVELAAPLRDVILDKTQAAWCTGYSLKIGGCDE
ncbi:baseplate assembly protein [Candidatus Fukatsuia endosymbiont of Tuberolachnus salignus]|uniref:baseplate assembly protein n=1 Tax=Candidatus Fukatsuia endosymbiont of Tuberolachnus salignus TaxID=3077957 RepID=UPI00313EA93E